MGGKGRFGREPPAGGRVRLVGRGIAPSPDDAALSPKGEKVPAQTSNGAHPAIPHLGGEAVGGDKGGASSGAGAKAQATKGTGAGTSSPDVAAAVAREAAGITPWSCPWHSQAA